MLELKNNMDRTKGKYATILYFNLLTSSKKRLKDKIDLHASHGSSIRVEQTLNILQFSTRDTFKFQIQSLYNTKLEAIHLGLVNQGTNCFY